MSDYHGNFSEGSKLSSAPWLVVLLACIFLLPEAYSIDVSLSAENGGDSVSIDSSYEVDTGVSVSEESEASFDEVGIENSRSISGSGDINAAQTYSGSGGYTGSATLNAKGVSGTLKGNTILTPSTLSASQIASLSGDSADVSLSLNHQGDLLYMGSGMGSGSLITSQNVQTGSVIGSQSSNIFANNGFVKFIKGTIKGANTILATGSEYLYIGISDIYSVEMFSGDAPSPLTSFISSLPGANKELEGGKKNFRDYSLSKLLVNSDKSQVKVDVDVKNADPSSSSYSWELDPDNQEASEKLTAVNANKIRASAYASNTEGDQSDANIEITEGSIYGYSNKAYADKTKTEVSEYLDSANGASVEVQSYAKNSARADEFFSEDAAGEIVTTPTVINKGTADFIVRRNEFTNALIEAKATSSTVEDFEHLWISNL
jgi:hypothetical protein